jgi:hypothetical protein
MFAAARPTYEPMMWGYGTDRKKAYGNMIDKQSYRDQLGVDPGFKGYEIFRTDDNISASKVRNALKIDDEKTFKKMTPKSIHSFYKTLQNTLQQIKENNNMKNLKSLNTFTSINEKVYNKKSLMKAVKGDDGIISTGDGKEYVIYNPNNGNDDNTDMWKDKVIFALDQDGEEHEIKYSDIVRYDENKSVNEEYIESMDSIEIANALGKIKTLWDAWKGGPMTEPSDIKPAQRELKGWMDRWFKQNIK